jgi:hypothetical protein
MASSLLKLLLSKVRTLIDHQTYGVTWAYYRYGSKHTHHATVNCPYFFNGPTEEVSNNSHYVIWANLIQNSYLWYQEPVGVDGDCPIQIASPDQVNFGDPPYC